MCLPDAPQIKLDRFTIPGAATFREFREVLQVRLEAEMQKIGRCAPVEGLQFIERTGQRRRDFSDEDPSRAFAEVVPNMGSIIIEQKSGSSLGSSPASASAGNPVTAPPSAVAGSSSAADISANTSASIATGSTSAKLQEESPHTSNSTSPPLTENVKQEADERANGTTNEQSPATSSASSVPAHWLASASGSANQAKATSSGKGKTKRSSKGPISSDSMSMGVGKIREVLQDVLRAARSLEGKPDAEDELCREVSVAAARVLTRHTGHGLSSILTPESQHSEESLKAQLKRVVATRLDTFQKELYNQNVFLQKVPAEVINDEEEKMWDQVLNQAFREAVCHDDQDRSRWVRALADEKRVRLRDPAQEAKEQTLISTLARGLRMSPADASNDQCSASAAPDGRAGV